MKPFSVPHWWGTAEPLIPTVMSTAVDENEDDAEDRAPDDAIKNSSDGADPVTQSGSSAIHNIDIIGSISLPSRCYSRQEFSSIFLLSAMSQGNNLPVPIHNATALRLVEHMFTKRGVPHLSYIQEIITNL